MLINTFESHPLLSQLAYKKNKQEGRIFGLYKYDLTASDDDKIYVIRERELKKVFKDRCLDNDIKSISIFLSFNYEDLSKLKENNPFYIKNKFFLDEQFILIIINKLNYLDKKEISMFLQEHIKRWLNEEINSADELISDDVCQALSAVALYQPKLAFKRLSKEFTDDFQISKEIIKNNNYRILLHVLEEMAATPKYFEFSSKYLLKFSAREVKLGVYHGAYKAFYYFNSLYRNSCVRTKVTLRERKEYLSQAIQQAKESNDYYCLYILAKTLGIAANVFESGEHDYVEDEFFESYINFALIELMNYAGIDDENGLSCTVEEELHTLIKSTIDEPKIFGAIQVPFLIFRLFLEKKQEWNIDPRYHLNDLDEYIEFCKQDKDADVDDNIKLLELRMQQLISLFSNREFISKDFILYLGAKHHDKICEIGLEIDFVSKLELHSRQSLAERLIFSEKTNIHEIERSWPKCTYIIANFGMVVSDRPHKESIPHKRLFKTMPIRISNYTITGSAYPNGGHAEEALYAHLLLDNNIELYLSMFKNQFGMNAPDHKVYAVIIDLHGTYDMCLSCSKKGLEFQNDFRKKLLSILKKQELKTLKKYPGQLPIIIRYSSDLKYHYLTESEDKKKGVLTIIGQESPKRDLTDYKTEPPSYVTERDLKFYGANLLIHGKSNWHSFWSKPKRKEMTGKSIGLESWTAFTSDSQIRSLSEQRKRVNYTHLGQVDTIDDEALPKIGQLTL